jgi:hypothetical protein
LPRIYSRRDGRLISKCCPSRLPNIPFCCYESCMFRPPTYASSYSRFLTNTRIRAFGGTSLLKTQTTSKLNNHSFKDALQLPHTSFPLRSDPINSELRFRDKTCGELYQWQVCSHASLLTLSFPYFVLVGWF